MLSRIWRVAHPLLTLALVGCCAYLLWRDWHRPGFGGHSAPDPARHSAHMDWPLRNFLGVNWLGGDYELPAGEDHCTVVMLRFEDGKFRGRQAGPVFSPRPGDSRVVPFYVMWGPGPKGTRVVSGWPGNWSSSDNNPFFANLNGGLGRTYGSDDSRTTLRGYRVIGHAFSQQERAESKNPRVSSIYPDFNIQNRQFVLVLGVKTFATEKEAEDWAYTQDEKPDP